MGGGKDVEVGPMSLCVALGLKGWTGNQLGQDEKMQNTQASCSGAQGWGETLCGKVLFDFPSLVSLSWKNPSGNPLAALSCIFVSWPCQELTDLSRCDSVTLCASSSGLFTLL